MNDDDFLQLKRNKTELMAYFDHTGALKTMNQYVIIALAILLGMIVSAAILVRTRASLGACRRQLDRSLAELSKVQGQSTVVTTS